MNISKGGESEKGDKDEREQLIQPTSGEQNERDNTRKRESGMKEIEKI